jgi:predicted phage terminase large subunit-like protein
MNWYLMVDPSYEGPYSDYAAFVVVGMDHMQDLYVRHVLRQKMTYSQIIQNIFALNDKYHPQYIMLETIATQKSIIHELNNEQKRRGRWLKIKETKSRTLAKEERIRGLAPWYEFGHVYHIKECNQLDDLEYELIHFPRGTHDDIIDALADVLEVATPPSSIEDGERKLKKKQQIAAYDKPRSPITGV